MMGPRGDGSCEAQQVGYDRFVLFPAESKILPMS